MRGGERETGGSESRVKLRRHIVQFSSLPNNKTPISTHLHDSFTVSISRSVIQETESVVDVSRPEPVDDGLSVGDYVFPCVFCDLGLISSETVDVLIGSGTGSVLVRSVGSSGREKERVKEDEERRSRLQSQQHFLVVSKDLNRLMLMILTTRPNYLDYPSRISYSGRTSLSSSKQRTFEHWKRERVEGKKVEGINIVGQSRIRELKCQALS